MKLQKILEFLPVVFLLVLSMYPIHSLPPVLSNLDFISRLNLSEKIIPIFTYAYYLGFLFAGLICIYRKFELTPSKLTIHITIAGWIFFYLLSLISAPSDFLILYRLLLGMFSFCMYSLCFVIIFQSFNGLAAYSSLFAVGTIILDSLAFINGISLDYLPTGVAKTFIYLVPTALALYVGYFYRHYMISNPDAQFTFSLKGIKGEVVTTLPSILINVAFFIFLSMLPLISSENISSFYIGLTIFTLSIAFPAGAKSTNALFRKLKNYSIVVYVTLSITGTVFFLISVKMDEPLLLIIGAMLMAFGNAGTLVINTFSASSDKDTNNAEPQITYMLSTSGLTIICLFLVELLGGSVAYYSYSMILIYALLILKLLTNIATQRKVLDVRT